MGPSIMFKTYCKSIRCICCTIIRYYKRAWGTIDIKITNPSIYLCTAIRLLQPLALWLALFIPWATGLPLLELCTSQISSFEFLVLDGFGPLMPWLLDRPLCHSTLRRSSWLSSDDLESTSCTTSGLHRWVRLQ